MEITPQSRLTFTGIDIINVSFVSAKQGVPPNMPVNMQIMPKVFYPEDRPNDFNIIMELTLKFPEYYDFSMVALGKFVINTELTGEMRKSFINVNAPAILFPYLRSFVSTFFSNLGGAANAVNILPQFFKGELEEIKITNITQ